MMGVDDSEGFVGGLGLFHPADVAEPLLVYVFDQRGWGKGYATEAVGLFLNWMTGSHKVRRVLCHIDSRNEASARVAAKFDATRIGIITRSGSELDVWCLPIPARNQER